MALSRNSTATGTNDSSSFNVTIGGSYVVSFITYDVASTLTASSLGGVSGSILQTQTLTGEGYKVSAVSYIGTFSGSKAVTFTWSGGTPANIRSGFLGYNGTKYIDVSASVVDTGGSVSASVTASDCWVVGASYGPTVAGASVPSTGTNNDGYYATTGTSNGLCRNCIGDSNGTVATGSQSVNTTTGGGYNFIKMIVVLQPAFDYTLAITQASFALTFYNIVLQYSKHYTLAITQASFTYSGYAISFILRLYTRLINQVKNSVSLTNTTKPAASSVTNTTKTTSSLTNLPKP